MMRRTLASIGCAIVVSMIMSLPAHAQAGRREILFSQPAKVRQERMMRRLFPEYHGKSFPREKLIIEEFYPIGWSKDGKFAYYTEPADEACDCYFAKLFILDTVNDKVLWSFDYNGLDDDRENPKYSSRNDLWRKNQKLFSDKLNQYGIVARGPFSLLTFPINHAGDQLRANLKTEVRTDEAARLYNIVAKVTLQLTSRRDGAKTIHEEAYPEAEPLDVKVLGYLKNPFEPRIAIILIEIQRGYEGPPHITRAKVVGASLTAGFK